MTLNKLYVSDNNFAPYPRVFMIALFENIKDVKESTVYFATMNFSQNNLDNFKAPAERYH